MLEKLSKVYYDILAVDQDMLEIQLARNLSSTMDVVDGTPGAS